MYIYIYIQSYTYTMIYYTKIIHICYFQYQCKDTTLTPAKKSSLDVTLSCSYAADSACIQPHLQNQI